nr:retrovirus-related Pol polyprotein from transposon TNT 1-94 [Tanacetum cinerariifolium]
NVFKTGGHIWKPTGRIFTLVGNVCTLTRIATTTIVPPREPILIVNSTDKPVVTLMYSRKTKAANKKVPVSNSTITKSLVVQIVLWYLDSGCSKHMTGDRSQLVNFIQNFLGTVKFGNDHVAKIMGYGDYQIGNATISWVYYVEGLGHNLFSVGQFCDSDLEVAFHQHTCFIRNLDGVDLLTGSRGNNLYTLSLQDMMAQGLVRGLPKLKFEKDYLCSACAMEKRQTFTLVGNVCPLTRIANPTIVPYREPIPIVNSTDKPVETLVVQIVLWYLDFGCSKHMTGDRSQLVNFVQKFLGTVNFRNDHVAKIMCYEDYHIGNVTISRVYYVEGLGHNLFSVGQFCDSDLEVAFRQYTCFIRNLDGVDLLTSSQGNNLYTLSLQDMIVSSPICLLSKASKTKSWLWHHRLSHLNFGAINHLARQGLVRGLPKLKFKKDHLCSACTIGKSTKKTHKPKSKGTNQEKLYLLHMDLCGPMRFESVNGKKYILVIVDDYSQFTWVKFLRSKDETLDFIIKFLKMIQVRLKVSVRRIRIDNGTEFVNQTLRDYYEEVGISHETSVARSPQQNGVVERRNCTLIEAARTMLIYAQAPLFLWVEAVATACFTQNRSIICLRHGKTPYELLHSKLHVLSFFHVFGALCYPTNDSKNLGPALNEMTPRTISSRLVRTSSPSTSYVTPSRNDWDFLFQSMFDELLNPPPSVVNQALEVIAPIAEVIPPVYTDSTGSPSSITIDQDAPSPSKSHTTIEIQSSIIPQDVGDDNLDMEVAHIGNDPLFGVPIPEVTSAQSSSTASPHSIVQTNHPMPHHNSK